MLGDRVYIASGRDMLSNNVDLYRVDLILLHKYDAIPKFSQQREDFKASSEVWPPREIFIPDWPFCLVEPRNSNDFGIYSRGENNSHAIWLLGCSKNLTGLAFFPSRS